MIVLAVFVPVLLAQVAIAACGADAETRRALRIGGGLTLLWMAPCWLWNDAPLPFDFLSLAPPWWSLRPWYVPVSNGLLNDPVLQLVPWRAAARGALANLQPPFLNRFAGSGAPLWVNLQTAFAYPLEVLAAPFSGFAYQAFTMTSKYLVAFGGMYLFLRKRVEVSHLAAVFGATGLAFGVFSVAWAAFPITNVTSLLPLLLFALGELIDRPSRKSFLFALAVLLALFTGGHPESMLHVLLVAGGYVLFVAKSRPALLRAAVVVVLAALLAAPLLLPLYEYLPHSQRMHEIRSSEVTLSLWSTAGTFAPLLVPDFFGNPRWNRFVHAANFNELCTGYAGVAVLVLAVVGVYGARRRTAGWLLAAGVAMLLAMPTPAVDRMISAVPLLNMTARGRVRFVMVFALLVIAAIGLDELRRTRAARIAAGAAAAAAGLGIVALLVVSPLLSSPGAALPLWASEAMPLLNVAALIALAAGAVRLVPLLPLLLFADLAGIMWLYNPAVDRRFYYPATLPVGFVCETIEPMQRVTGVGSSLLPNSATVFGLEDIRPHDPLSFRPYVRFLEEFGFDSGEYPGLFVAEPPRQLLDFLGVSHVFVEPKWRSRTLPVAFRDENGAILRNRSALPRYFVPGEVRAASDPIAAFRQGGSASLVFSDALRITPSDARISVTEYGRNGAKMEARTAGASFIASSEVALPGYRLFRDGGEWPITVINGAFIGWQVPAGRSDFELRYVPEGLGAALVLAGLGILGVLLAMHRRFWR